MALVELNLNPDKKQLRTFGAIGLFAFGGLGLFIWTTGRLFGFELGVAAPTVAYALLSLAMFCGFAAAVMPRLLKPIFIAMTLVTLPIGFVVSHVVMLGLFFLLITPMGLVMRLIGRDPLARTIDRTQKSYWSTRPPAPPVERYFRQF